MSPAEHAPIRMLATDLDGTLLRRDGTVSDFTTATLARARTAGFPVLFVTGRPPRWMAPVVRATGHAGLAVCSNGAVMVDLDAGRIMAFHPIARDLVLALGAVLRDAVPGTAFGVELVPTVDGDRAQVTGGSDTEGAEAELAAGADRFTAVRSYAHEQAYLPPTDPRYGPLVGPLEELVSHGHVVKLLARGPAGVDPDTMLCRANDALGDLAEVTRSTWSEPLLEIAAPGVSKASAVAERAAQLGLSREDVAAVGDMPNDIPLLRWAGHAYAVDTAHADVLAVVDQVIGRPEADGVAALLADLLDSE